MKTLPLVCLATILLATAASSRAPADDVKSRDGTWVPVSAELLGDPLDKANLKAMGFEGMKLVIDGNKYTVTLGGDSFDKGTVKLDPTAKPMTMDIIGTDGPNKGKTILAICDVNGDTMRVCYDLSGKARPTEFKTKLNEPTLLITWKRAKP